MSSKLTFNSIPTLLKRYGRPNHKTYGQSRLYHMFDHIFLTVNFSAIAATKCDSEENVVHIDEDCMSVNYSINHEENEKKISKTMSDNELSSEEEHEPVFNYPPPDVIPISEFATDNSGRLSDDRRGCTTSKNVYLHKQGVSLELYNSALWEQFHELGTEMIITKAGRRMFPSLKLKISGLNPEATYTILVEMALIDDKRYRYLYHSSQWVIAGQGDPPLTEYNCYVHPDSPATGEFWLKQKEGLISFDKLKLTNNKHPGIRGQISLHSMHKYQPIIHVIEMASHTSDSLLPLSISRSNSPSISFNFQQVNFITVTAYQNQQITHLKITSNPFAKGFRENAKHRNQSDLLPFQLDLEETLERPHLEQSFKRKLM
ncbi:T-box transcription factor TBX18 [Nymphon striatum]|nr:T-box transcription factor TBX18 [Nymphon striatum]